MASFNLHVRSPIDQSRTSPSPPPLMTSSREKVVATAVTPLLWALSISYSNLPDSGVNPRILPSFQPESITKSVPGGGG